MNLTLTGGSGRQRQWVKDAIAFCTYPFEIFTHNVEVEWVDEPPCPGHKEYACTNTDADGNSVISIRNTLDNVVKYPPPWGGKKFYMETVVHELMHAVWFALAPSPEASVAWFYQHVAGGGAVYGRAGDYAPTDKPWPDRIKEAVAEALKDTFLPDAYREGDNRTNWKLDRNYLPLLLTAVSPYASSGSGLFVDPGYVFALIPDVQWWGHQWKKLPSDVPKVARLTMGLDHTAPNIAHDVDTHGLQFQAWFATLAAPSGHADPAPTAVPDNYVGPLTYDTGGLPPGTVEFPRGTAFELEQQGFIPLLGQWGTGGFFGTTSGDIYTPGFNSALDWGHVPNQEQPPVPADYDHWIYAIYLLQPAPISPGGPRLRAGAPYPPVASFEAPPQPVDAKWPYVDPHMGAGTPATGVIRCGHRR